MEVLDLSLQGLKLIKPRVFRDERGFFLESFRQSLFVELGINCSFLQDNHSYSQQGTLRGMHFQSFPGQAKLIRVAVGQIYDVAVDIRPASSTYGKWEGVVLDDQSHHQFFIPVGFAHGFCVLSQHAHVLYKVSTPYDPQFEKGFVWNDPTINIRWPIEHPLVSKRDQEAPSFCEIEQLMESKVR